MKKLRAVWGKIWITHFTKPFVYLGVAMFYLFISFGINIAVTNEAQAQNCTGTTYACNTFNGSSWSTVQGSNAVTSFSSSAFTFEKGTTYPMTSDNVIEKSSSPPIYLTVLRNPSTAANAKYFVSPTNNLIWNQARNGYNVRGFTTDLVLRIEARVGNVNRYRPITGASTTQIDIGLDTINALPRNGAGARVGNVTFNVKITAVLYAPQPASIDIPTMTIFNMYGPGGSNGQSQGELMGSVNISGAPAIVITPPKPKTCDTIPAGTTRVFNLNPIDVTSLRAGAESSASATQNVTLTNCPTGITLRMAMSDSAFPNNNNDYLRNQSGTDYATNAGIRLYYNGTEKVTMNSWRRDVTTTTATMNLPFTAKYYHIGGNLGIGKVRSTATLTITYP